MKQVAVEEEDVIRGCIESCDRLLLVAETVPGRLFHAAWKAHNGIGPHLRHCYEHLAALQNGFEAGTVRYDARERNETLERDPDAYVVALEPVVHWLRSLTADRLDTPLTVCQIPRVDTQETRSASTLRRELLFLTTHTIHHLALVALLAEIQGIALPPELGVAFSTTTHDHLQTRGAAPVAVITS